jgi:hypothetical protein
MPSYDRFETVRVRPVEQRWFEGEAGVLGPGDHDEPGRRREEERTTSAVSLAQGVRAPGVRRSAVFVAVVLAVSAAACSQGQSASPLRTFSYTGEGTNVVNIQPGQLNEHWTGYANANGVQNNRFTEEGAGQISWNS